MLAVSTKPYAFPAVTPKAWEIVERPGPVLATAIHAGHEIRSELRPFLAASESDLRREEDPLTGVWAGAGDSVFRTTTSRFEVDLNRRRAKAFSADPKDTWGLRVWREQPPQTLVERSLTEHDAFYRYMGRWLETMISKYRRVLVLDIHSYNHRRTKGDPAPQEANPDIDLGVTTVDMRRFESVVDRLEESLQAPTRQRLGYDVRRNVRYPDGGYFPEWVFSNYGDAVCTVTLEVKKFYMDECTGLASLAESDLLMRSISAAVEDARREILLCP